MTPARKERPVAKVAKDIVETRPREIADACRKLYRTMAFQEITLKDISRETSLSRPSIYNYFQTKEEIFLYILEDEYREWGDSLEKMLKENDALGIEGFAAELAASLRDRETMLRIQCMNLYEIEENSREERLVSFKKEYGRSRELVSESLRKFFPTLTDEDRDFFIFEFFPFMYGIYPYAYPTAKQMAAMAKTGIKAMDISIEGLARRCVSDLLRSAINGKEERG